MKRLLSTLILLCLFGCSEPEVPGGEITVQNDIRDKSYNIVNVHARGSRTFRASIKPGKRAVLPNGTRTIRFSRKYADHTKVYEVDCPKKFNKKITVRLIDVHSNRIAGGCKLVKRGRINFGSYIKWEK